MGAEVGSALGLPLLIVRVEDRTRAAVAEPEWTALTGDAAAGRGDPARKSASP